MRTDICFAAISNSRLDTGILLRNEIMIKLEMSGGSMSKMKKAERRQLVFWSRLLRGAKGSPFHCD